MNYENTYLKDFVIAAKFNYCACLKLLVVSFLLFFSQFINTYSAWKEIPNEPVDYRNVTWLDIYFLDSDPNYGWLCGWDFQNRYGSILRTTDGGQTWSGTRVADAGQLESITFVSPLVGYTSGNCSHCGMNSGVIKKSTDGGRTWFDVTPAGYYGSLWGNFFLDENNGWVIGEGCNGTGQYFFKTTDGGRSWTSFYTNQGETGLTDLIMLDKDGLGYAVSSGYLWQTGDGGRSWRIISKTGGVDWQEEIAISGNSFLMPYALTCTGHGAGGGMRFSVDGGKTWRDHRLSNQMFGAFLLDSLRGWIAGKEPVVYYTSDGGLTWQLKNCGIEEEDELDDIWFIDDTTGFAVGTAIYKYIVPDTLYPEITPDTINLCPGDSAVIRSADKTIYRNYFWSNGETSDRITVKKEGEYYLKVIDRFCNEGVSNISRVFIREEETEIIPGDTVWLCKGDSLSLTTRDKHFRTIWSSGEEGDSLEITKPGKYGVTVYNEYGCKAIDSVVVLESDPQPEIRMIGDSILCEDDTIFLESIYDYAEYRWYKEPEERLDGGTKRIRIFDSGVYYIEVRDIHGCPGISDTLAVEVKLDSNRLEILSQGENVLLIDTVNFTNYRCRKFLIKNSSAEPYLLENIYLFRNIDFSAPQNQFPIYMEPYDTASVVICFSPIKTGESRDTVMIKDICWNHYAEIVSSGKGNLYDGDSRCEVPVKIETSKLTGYLFETSKPAPNPTGFSFRVSFAKFTPEGEDYKESAALYDVLGNIRALPEKTINTEFNNKDGSYVTGEYYFNTKNLPNGAYIVVIKTIYGSKALPVAVEK